MGLKMSFELCQMQTHRIDCVQRLQLRTRTLGLKLRLILELREVQYIPSATCLTCGYKLKPLEILQGFTADVDDMRTTCPKCTARFEARLVTASSGSRMELLFYCKNQALHRLSRLADLEPKQIQKEFPSLFHSVIVHFGSIAGGFKDIGIAYAFPDRLDWKNKVVPFLGLLPDVEIARCANVSASRIGYLRRNLGISRYVLADYAVEDGDE